MTEEQQQIYDLIESAKAENITLAFEISKSLEIPIDFVKYTRTWLWLQNLPQLSYLNKVRMVPHEVKQELTGVGDIYIWLLMQETDFCYHKSFGIFDDFPTPVTNMTNVETIVLSYHNIQKFPRDEMLNLKNLKSLKMDGNPLLKEEILWFKENFPRCEFIFDKHLLNDMTEEESQISQFLDSGSIENIQLAYAIAESNNIKIDEQAYHNIFHWLSVVKAKGFEIERPRLPIKNKIELVASVEHLNLSIFSRLNQIPFEIVKCANLKTLDLHGCPIDRLPSTITNMKNLDKLDISFTNIPNQIVDRLKEQMPHCEIIYETYDKMDYKKLLKTNKI